MPKLTTCLQGQPEYLGESQPAESQSQGRVWFDQRRDLECGQTEMEVGAGLQLLYPAD